MNNHFTWKCYLDLRDKQTNIDGSYKTLDEFIQRVYYLHQKFITFINERISSLEKNQRYVVLKKLLNYSYSDIYNDLTPFERHVLNYEYNKLISDYGFGYYLSGNYINSNGQKPTSIVKQFSDYSKIKKINIRSCNSFLEAIEKNKVSASLQSYFYKNSNHIHTPTLYNYGVNNKGFSSTSEQVCLVDKNSLDTIQIWKNKGEVFTTRQSKKREDGRYKDELEGLIREGVINGSIKPISCQIKKEYFNRKVRYSVNFLFTGEKPMTAKQKLRESNRANARGNVGIDLGPKTIAVHFEGNTPSLLTLNNTHVLKYESKIQSLNQKIQKQADKLKHDSENEKLLQQYEFLYSQLRSVYRKKQEHTRNYQNVLAHYIHTQASTILIEEKNIKEMRKVDGFKNKSHTVKYKCFERSIQNYSPAALYNRIVKLCEDYEHELIVVPNTYCASQYDIYGNKTKKKLKDRILYQTFNNMEYLVQRDLFSAFLLTYPNGVVADFATCQKEFTSFIAKQEVCLMQFEPKWSRYRFLLQGKRNNTLTKKERNELTILQEELPSSYGLKSVFL